MLSFFQKKIILPLYWLWRSLGYRLFPPGNYKIIKKSGLFDRDWYREQDVRLRRWYIDPLVHYCEYGWQEKRNPNRLFCSSWYLLNNKDCQGQDPLLHYLEKGWQRGANPCSLFFTSWYAGEYPDSIAEGNNPLAHYLHGGGRAGCEPNPAFATKLYLSNTPGAVESNLAPLEHFIEQIPEIAAYDLLFFDYNLYKLKCPTLSDWTETLLSHFLYWGEEQGFAPFRLFDSRFYTKEAGLLPGCSDWLLFFHYISCGAGAGLNPCNWFDSSYYENRYPDYSTTHPLPILHYLDVGVDKGNYPCAELEDYLHKPLVSIVVPVYNSDLDCLRLCVDSVLNQLYPHWQLCLVDDGSTKQEVKEFLENISAEDNRIIVEFLNHNQGISAAANRGVEIAKGDFIAFLDHDDELQSSALAEVVCVLNLDEADVLYSNECLIGENSDVHEFFYKPDFNRVLLDNNNYINHLLVVKKELFAAVGGLDSEFDGAQDYDLVLKLADYGAKFYHIDKVLYNWRAHEGSTSVNHESKNYAHEAGKKALLSSFARRGQTVEVTDGQFNFYYRVIKPVTGKEKISLLVLVSCIEGEWLANLFSFFHPQITELIFLVKEEDKAGLKEELNRFDFPCSLQILSFSETDSSARKFNYGAAACKGDYLLLLDSGVEILSEKWIDGLLAGFLTDKVAMVTGWIFPPDGYDNQVSLQPDLKNLSTSYYNCFLQQASTFKNGNFCDQQIWASSWNLTMIKRETFLHLNGFDEEFLGSCLADTDFSFRLGKQGWDIVYKANVLGRWYESAYSKRGNSPDERNFFQDRWRFLLLAGDPWYNRNILLDKQYSRKDFNLWYAGTGESSGDEVTSEAGSGASSSMLVQLNNLSLQNNGVFSCGNSDISFYSDGREEEEYLYNLICNCSDVSLSSQQLQNGVRSWVTEYHLSINRANSFRAIDFSSINSVLEIGCGCGAITRFLGEQGVKVDALDGSMQRAEITRLRCRDLDNVNVVQADFNNLVLPDQEYDLVVLNGVLEYAGKYCQSQDTPLAAVIAILKKIELSLTIKGRVVIGIENRLGFKYLAGANEDHFAKPWIGTSGYPDCVTELYPDRKGISTWSRDEWQKILSYLPDLSSSWYFPFPDYKLPSLIISENFVDNYPLEVASMLSRVHSRDYSAYWHPSIDESLFWQIISESRNISKFANSFFIVLAKNNSLDGSSLISHDFIHFSGDKRKPEYRVMVCKREDEEKVQKQKICNNPVSDNDLLVHRIGEDNFYSGELLSFNWQNILRACPTSAIFDKLCRDYYEYIEVNCGKYGANNLLDLLPSNIVVNKGGWKFFDQEWEVLPGTLKISSKFIFFRGILYFFVEYYQILSPLCKEQGLFSCRDFIQYIFERHFYSSEFDLDDFIAQEDSLQKSILRESCFSSLKDFLQKDISGDRSIVSQENFCTMVWGEPAVSISPEVVKNDLNNTGLSFRLSADFLRSGYFQLVFNFGAEQLDSSFIVDSITVYERLANGQRNMLFGGNCSETCQLMKLTALTLLDDGIKKVFIVDAQPPQVIHYKIPGIISASSGCMFLECEVAITLLAGSGLEMRLLALKKKNQELEVEMYKLNECFKTCPQAQSTSFLASLKSKVRNSFSSKGMCLKKSKLAKIKSKESSAQPNPFFSVVMAVYNVSPEELRNSINSVKRQTFKNWELVIIDGGSDNGATLDFLATIKEDNIKVNFLKKSINITYALRESVSILRGEWVTFIGNFDSLQTEALEKVAEEIRRNSPDIIYSDEKLIDRSGKVIGEWKKDAFEKDKKDIVYKEDPIGSGVFIKRTLLATCCLPDPDCDRVQFFDMVLRASLSSAKITHLPLPLYKKRVFEEIAEEEKEFIAGLLKYVSKKNS